MHRLLRGPRRMLHALRSLQWQLSVSYAAMAALLCTAMGLVVMRGLDNTLMAQDRTDLNRRAVVAADLIYHDLGLTLAVVLAEASQATRARVCAYDTAGGQLGCSAAGLVSPPGVSPLPAVDDRLPRA